MDVQCGLVELYRPLLKNVIDVLPILNSFIDHLQSDKLQEIRNLYETGDPAHACDVLLTALQQSVHSTWFVQLTACLKDKPESKSAYNALVFSGIKDSTHFRQLLIHCNILLQNIEPLEVANALLDRQCLSQQDLQVVKQQHRFVGNEAATRMLLQYLPKLNDNWYVNFMDILSTSPKYAAVVAKICPNYDAEKAKFKIHDHSKVHDLIQFEDSDSPVIDDGPSTIHERDDHADSGVFSSRADNSSCNGALAAIPDNITNIVETLTLRAYQNELTAPALEGKNTVVCAPTGSGKTFVAVKIILEHLRDRNDNSHSVSCGKIAFFVPTTSLVDQQGSVLKRFLEPRYKVACLKGGQASGGLAIPKFLAIRHAHVTVMTPALLLNMLLFHDEANDQPIRVTTFSLFIFDECHHTDKDHPYNAIMQLYFDMKLQNTLALGEKLPQIVGLTASLGVGKADTDLMAREYVLQTCSRLDAHALATVEKNKEELEKQVNVPRDELVKVPATHGDHPFNIYVISMMETVEKMLVPALKLIENCKAQAEVPDKHWLPKYKGWLGHHLRHVPIISDADLKRRLMTYLEFLEICHEALYINVHVLAKYAVDFIEKAIASLRRKQTTELEATLVAMYDKHQEFIRKSVDAGSNHNYLVEKLRSILIKEYDLHTDARTIVFACTRHLTVALESYMNEDQKLAPLRATRIVSSNAAAQQGGQSAAQQQQRLEEFRKGERKVIIATTVAEEGIDIEQCNLVIKYNHVTNEIAMVQKRGRGRAENSRSILLCAEGWIAEKEYANMLRERLMNRAITYLRTLQHSAFLEIMKKYQTKDYQDRQIEIKIRQKKIVEFGGKTYQLLCKHCDALIAHSSNVKKIQSQYVISDRTCWSRMYGLVDPNGQRDFEDMHFVGKLHCIQCNADWGQVVKSSCAFWPVVRAEACVLMCDQDQTRHGARKWKQVVEKYFWVDQATQADKITMYKAEKTPRCLDQSDKMEEDDAPC